MGMTRISIRLRELGEQLPKKRCLKLPPELTLTQGKTILNKVKVASHDKERWQLNHFCTVYFRQTAYAKKGKQTELQMIMQLQIDTAMCTNSTSIYLEHDRRNKLIR